MRILFILTAFLFFSGTTPAPLQEQITYSNRLLEKTLKKAGMPFGEWQELKSAKHAGHNMHGMFFTYAGNEPGEYAYLYVGRVFSCRTGGCVAAAPADAETISSEYFDYFMLFDAQITIKELRIFNYQATHGHEVSARGWLKQFVGHRASEKLEVEKNIDAISGATISVYALTHDVEVKAGVLGVLVGKPQN